jgi:hypothetical protein
MDKPGVVTAAQAPNTNSEEAQMPSAEPSAGSPQTGITSGLHRMPRALAAIMRSPQEVVVTAPGAPNTTNVRSWFNQTFSFYLVGSSTWAAQFSVDAYGKFILHVYSATNTNTGSGDCFLSIHDQSYGVLSLSTVAGPGGFPPPYLWFPCPSGVETIQDTCFGRGGTSRKALNWAWTIAPANAAGDTWVFSDSRYAYPFNKFLFRKGPLSGAAVQAEASRAVDQLETLPEEFWVEPSPSLSVTSVSTRAAQVDNGPEPGAEQATGRARRPK